MNDTARVLLTAAVLSGLAISTFAWRVARLDPGGSDRLIGELRLAQWAAVLLAGVGGIPIGLVVAGPAVPAANLDATLAVLFIGLAGVVLQREPRDGLLIVAAGFILHALVDLAHRPGWLPPSVTPRWYVVGCATYNVYLAGWCYWARRR